MDWVLDVCRGTGTWHEGVRLGIGPGLQMADSEPPVPDLGSRHRYPCGARQPGKIPTASHIAAPGLTTSKGPDIPAPTQARRLPSDHEKIVEVGAEGGSITLFGVRTAHGWRFTRSLDEGIDDISSRNRSEPVDSWNAALSLLDK